MTIKGKHVHQNTMQKREKIHILRTIRTDSRHAHIYIIPI